MKKILILSMSCSDGFFRNQCEVIKQTWGRDILEGKYPNIDLLFYDGWNEQNTYDKKEHFIHVRCEDDIYNTYKKTHYLFKILRDAKFEYDYIFRTNTSTFVNVPLLNEFIQSLETDDVLWSSELYSLSESMVPYPLYLYGRGNGMILSKKLVDIILQEGINFLYLEKCDDWIIGNILNGYWLKKGENYLDHVKGYKHGWFKATGVPVQTGHQLCPYSNDKTDFNFLKQFITIQIKRYRERDIENDNYWELDKIFTDNTDTDLKATVEDNKKYGENPSVFIGSILGYVNYKDWASYDRYKLYDLEVTHKASDDAERYKKHGPLM